MIEEEEKVETELNILNNKLKHIQIGENEEISDNFKYISSLPFKIYNCYNNPIPDIYTYLEYVERKENNYNDGYVENNYNLVLFQRLPDGEIIKIGNTHYYNNVAGIKELYLRNDYKDNYRLSIKYITSYKSYPTNIQEFEYQLWINNDIDITTLNVKIPNLLLKMIMSSKYKILPFITNDYEGEYSLHYKLIETKFENEETLNNIQQNIECFKKLYPHQLHNIEWMSQIENKSNDNQMKLDIYHYNSANLYKFQLDNQDYYFDYNLRKIIDVNSLEIDSIQFNGGILSDEVGLGKTLSMIGLMIKQNKNNNCNPSLVICPRRLCVQWKDEIEENSNLKCYCILTISHYKKLLIENIKDYDIVILPVNFLKHQEYLEIKKKIESNEEQHDYYQKWVNLDTFMWERVILDESQEFFKLNSRNYLIREYTSRIHKLNSKYRWICSGTPFKTDIEYIHLIHYLSTYKMYNETEYKKCFMNCLINEYVSDDDIINKYNNIYIHYKDILGLIARRNTKDSLNTDFDIPKPIMNTEFLLQTEVEKAIYEASLGDTTKLIQICNHVLVSEDHSKILGNKPMTLEEIHTKMTSYYKTQLEKMNKRDENYKKKLETVNKKLSELLPLDQKMIQEGLKLELDNKILNNNNLIRELQSKFNIFDKLSQKIQQDKNCPICFESILETDKAITLCGHLYCKDCIESIIKNYDSKCAICRKSIQKSDVEIIKYTTEEEKSNNNNEEDNQEIINQWGTKMGNLIKYIKNTLDKTILNRMIIFSQYEKMLKLVEGVLKEMNIEYVLLKGQVHVLNSRIKKFKKDKNIRVVLLSSDNSPSGLNLTQANHIVLLDSHNAKPHECNVIEEQAIGRAVRMGQTLRVKVKRFVMKNTIEEENYNLNKNIIC